jgi:hypothetical protein
LTASGAGVKPGTLLVSHNSEVPFGVIGYRIKARRLI